MKMYVKQPASHTLDIIICDAQQQQKYMLSSCPMDPSLLCLEDTARQRVGLVKIDTFEYDSVIRMGVDGSMHDTVWIRSTVDGLKIDCCGWKVQGNPRDCRYCIYAGTTPIIETHRTLEQNTAVDILEIADTQDERLAVMLVIAINKALQNRRIKTLS